MPNPKDIKPIAEAEPTPCDPQEEARKLRLFLSPAAYGDNYRYHGAAPDDALGEYGWPCNQTE